MSKARAGMPRQAIRQDSIRLVCIEAFVRVVNACTFVGASRSLGVDEATIRRDIKELETWLSKKLFIRGRKLSLTPHGERFLPDAKQIVELMITARYPSDMDIIGAEKGVSEDQIVEMSHPISTLGGTIYEID